MDCVHRWRIDETATNGVFLGGCTLCGFRGTFPVEAPRPKKMPPHFLRRPQRDRWAKVRFGDPAHFERDLAR